MVQTAAQLRRGIIAAKSFRWLNTVFEFGEVLPATLGALIDRGPSPGYIACHRMPGALETAQPVRRADDHSTLLLGASSFPNVGSETFLEPHDIPSPSSQAHETKYDS